MKRRAEPELMDGEHAVAYAAADLTELQQSIVTYFQERFGGFAVGRLLDLGCGAADVGIRFARAFPGIKVLGVDGSQAMLACGREAIRKAELESRIELERHHFPDAALETGKFDAVIANSVLHHLPNPQDLWQTAVRCVKPGGAVMVMDLRRPPDAGTAERLVAAWAAEASPLLQQDFLDSLRAAYTVDEVRRQLDAAGLSDFRVETAGDVHLVAWGCSPRSS